MALFDRLYTTFYWSTIVNITIWYRFWVIWRWMISWPWNLGWGSFKIIQTGTIWKIWCGFLFAFHINYCSVLHHFRDKARYWSKIVTYSYPSCIRRPLTGASKARGVWKIFRRNIAILFRLGKPEWWSYLNVKKNFGYMCNRLDRIRACDRHTDGQTSCHGTVRAMHAHHAVKTTLNLLLPVIMIYYGCLNSAMIVCRKSET